MFEFRHLKLANIGPLCEGGSCPALLTSLFAFAARKSDPKKYAQTNSVIVRTKLLVVSSKTSKTFVTKKGRFPITNVNVVRPIAELILRVSVFNRS